LLGEKSGILILGKEDNFEEDGQLIFRDLGGRRGNPCGHSDEKLC
jgi:hypothetical protein